MPEDRRRRALLAIMRVWNMRARETANAHYEVQRELERIHTSWPVLLMGASAFVTCMSGLTIFGFQSHNFYGFEITTTKLTEALFIVSIVVLCFTFRQLIGRENDKAEAHRRHGARYSAVCRWIEAAVSDAGDFPELKGAAKSIRTKLDNLADDSPPTTSRAWPRNHGRFDNEINLFWAIVCS